MNLPLSKNFEPFAKISSLKLRPRKPDPIEIEKQELMQSFTKTGEELDHAIAQFNNATEQFLIDMYAYEIKALEQKHSYYLSRMRNLDENFQRAK